MTNIDSVIDTNAGLNALYVLHTDALFSEICASLTNYGIKDRREHIRHVKFSLGRHVADEYFDWCFDAGEGRA